MSTLNEDLSAIKEVEDKIIANKVARFAYTDEAYTTNDANGVAEYNVNNAQNIPTADASVLKVNETVLSKGYRAQASSITRMLVNHFFGRMSYNLNKVNDNVSSLIATLIGHRGTANGFATLDENGRIPFSQLPESAFWEYIKSKISSVLGLTKDNYGGKSAKSSFLDEYVGAGGTRITSLNIVPKDASEYGGMRKDIAPASVTDDNSPGANGHLLTMFWDNDGRYDNQLFIAGTTVKVRRKANGTDYEPWVDIITSESIGSQTVANANIGMVHTCSTAKATKEKTVSIPGFTLKQGACIRIVFNNGNSVARPTLNVNNTGAKEILGPYGARIDTIIKLSDISSGQVNVKGSNICNWESNIVLDLYYDGTYWNVIDDPIVMRFVDGSTQLKKNISMLGNLQTSIFKY